MPPAVLAATLAALLTAAVGVLGYLAVPRALAASAAPSAFTLSTAPLPPDRAAPAAPPGARPAEPRWLPRENPAPITSVFVRQAPRRPQPPAPAPAAAPAAAGLLPSAPALLPAVVEAPKPARLSDAVPAAIRRWEPLILRHAARNDLDPHLLAALMHVESAGREDAVSPKNAVGLMQVLDGPADPEQNVAQGAAILASHLRTFGDLDLALAAYNAGPGAVARYGGVPPYDETRWHIYLTRWWYWAYTRA